MPPPTPPAPAPTPGTGTGTSTAADGHAPAAVHAEGLTKRFGRTVALDGLDLHVPAGTVCGLLGPNGAGKSTTVRILATLTRPDAGRARVAGHDVHDEPHAVRSAIALAGQHAGVDEQLTGRENLELFARLRRLRGRAARARAAELLDRFDLAEAADRLVSGWSGGMRRRLDLIANLLVPPRVLLLDEPTTGLDPRSRAEIWQAVRGLAEQDGVTVLLTTQYLEEADRLADAVAVIDRGRTVAAGTPAALKERIGSRVEVVLADEAQVPAARAVLMAHTGREPADLAPDGLAGGARLGVTVPGPRARGLSLPELVRRLDGAGVAARDVTVRPPSLDEAYLTLTGHGRGREPGSSDGSDDVGDDGPGDGSRRKETVR